MHLTTKKTIVRRYMEVRIKGGTNCQFGLENKLFEGLKVSFGTLG